MRNQGILRGLAIIMMAGGLIAAPSPASAATLAGTEQVWQGGDWAVESTPYWCRAYPASAKKNADGIPAVALIQWDGKVYLEFALPKNEDAASKSYTVNLKVDGATISAPFSQIAKTKWGTVPIDSSTVRMVRAGKSMRMMSDGHWSAGYSLSGSAKAMNALAKCSAGLKPTDEIESDPMARVEPNRALQPRGDLTKWVPVSAFPSCSSSERGTLEPLPSIIVFTDEPCCFQGVGPGTIAFVLKIRRDGRPIDCIETEISGDRRLSGHTCSHLMKRAKFDPMTDSYGYPIESE